MLARREISHLPIVPRPIPRLTSNSAWLKIFDCSLKPCSGNLKTLYESANHGCNAGFLNLWATEESSMDHGLTLKLSAFLNLDVLMENVVSSSATNVVISSLVTTACVRNYCNMEISHKAYHVLHNMQLLEGILRPSGDFCCHENEMQNLA